jgi:hypothetical protein
MPGPALTSRAARRAACAVLATLLLGTQPGPARAQHSNGVVTIDPTRLLGFALGDWNGDFRDDRAVLVESEDGESADLLVFLTGDGDGELRLIRADRIAWMGSMAGQAPYLERRENGSLVVVSENETIGRDRWRIELTIAYREGSLQVGGFTMHSRDTLDPENVGDCDINLFTGRGIRNGVEIRTALRASPIEEWDMDRIPEECWKT